MSCKEKQQQLVCVWGVATGVGSLSGIWYGNTYGANIVANDEIIAKILQEELENVTAAEASKAAGAIVPVFKHLQVQYWLGV